MHATSSANAPNLRSRKRLFMMFLLGLEMFYTRESLLVKYKVAERALTHKLAEYLQMLFCGYNVDCEYNKVGDGEPKRVEALVAKMRKVQKMQQGNKCNGDCNNCTPNKCVVFPDIIVHRRGKDRNLLVVEAKTEWGGASQNEDFEKLKALTTSTDYKYQLGVGFRFCETLEATIKTIIVFMKPDIEIRAPVISGFCRFRFSEIAERILKKGKWNNRQKGDII